MVLPIGIGDIGRETPEMTTTVIAENPNPTWVPGPGRKSWLEQKGIDLPAVVPGPDNPLGKFAMRLGYGNKDYLIHGTNKDFGVGLRVSAGCIRLRPDDIETLFGLVPVGTPVRVINQPVKMAVEPDGRRWLEVHSLSRTEAEMAQGRRWCSPRSRAVHRCPRHRQCPGDRPARAQERAAQAVSG
jgi:hypothetical protein